MSGQLWSTSEGGAQDSDYIWEVAKHSTWPSRRPYMRLTAWRLRSRKLLCKNRGLGIVEGFPPLKDKTETAHKAGASNVGAPATVGNFAPQVGKRKKNFGWWWCTCIYWYLSTEPLRASSLKESAVGAVWKWTPWKKKTAIRRTVRPTADVESAALEKKGTVICR
jgi:hypothetical protein